MSRDYFMALGLGVVAALLYLSITLRTPGAVVLANMAQLPLFFTGLGWGVMAALVASGAASAAVLAVLPVKFFALFVATTVVPVVVLVYLALQSRPSSDGGVEWYPLGYLLSWLSGLALIGLIGAALIFAGEDGGLEGVAHRYVEAMMRGLAHGTPQARVDELTAAVARILPASALTSWQFVVLGNGLLAQGLLVRFDRNLRPGAPFATLELPFWPSVALALCAAAALVGGQVGFVGRNGAVAMSVPFFFLGLSVIHAVTSGWPGRPFALLVVYLLILFQGWPAILVAGLGFVERWLHLRRRGGGPDRGREKE